MGATETKRWLSRLSCVQSMGDHNPQPYTLVWIQGHTSVKICTWNLGGYFRHQYLVFIKQNAHILYFQRINIETTLSFLIEEAFVSVPHIHQPYSTWRSNVWFYFSISLVLLIKEINKINRMWSSVLKTDSDSCLNQYPFAAVSVYVHFCHVDKGVGSSDCYCFIILNHLGSGCMLVSIISSFPYINLRTPLNNHLHIDIWSEMQIFLAVLFLYICGCSFDFPQIHRRLTHTDEFQMKC